MIRPKSKTSVISVPGWLAGWFALWLMCLSSSVHAQQARLDGVLGGQDAAQGQLPAMVALAWAGFPSYALSYRQFCGATAISSTHVLTAAHCMFSFEGDPLLASQVNVAVGHIVLNNATQEVAVADYTVHPSYDHNSVNLEYDIAILRLAEPLQIDTFQKLYNASSTFLVGRTAEVYGWGSLNFAESESEYEYRYPDTLQVGYLPVVSLETCNSHRAYNGWISHRQICAGYANGGVDSCLGDSGGPLVVNLDSGEPVQVGIVSWGNGCGLADSYGIYTDLYAMRSFVTQFVPDAYADEVSSARLANHSPSESDGGLSAGGASAGDSRGGGGAAGWLSVVFLVMVGGVRNRKRFAKR